MVVDDEEFELRMLREVLEALFPDTTIDTFVSGTVALKELKNVQYDCVITDIVMRDMEGHVLPDRILKVAKCPIIVRSSLPDWGSSRTANFAAIIEKPGRVEQLGDTVGKIIGIRPQPLR